MSHELNLQETQKEWHGTLKSYIIGFLSCLILTGISFLLAYSQWLTGHSLLYALIALGLIQAVVQMFFFLHVGQEDHPKWETISFGFMVMCVLILIVGSLWVMNDLDKRMMPKMEHNATPHD